MNVPIATYRLQFTPDFGFHEARNILNYLSALGISDIYGSPVFHARPGSTHGYDVVDQNRLNPELGTPDGYRKLMESVRQLRMGWIQDIVPNHMAFHSSNEALTQVFEFGRHTPFFNQFDIDWDHPDPLLKKRVIAPFLEKPLKETLQDSEIQLRYGEGGFYFQWHSFHFPLFSRSYRRILQYACKVGDGGAKGSLNTLIRQVKEKAQAPELFYELKKKLWNLYQSQPSVRRSILQALKDHNTRPIPGKGKGLLVPLLDEQKFLLEHWEVSNRKINYRRFFTINDLISVRVERDEVFRHTHRFIFEQFKRWKWTGLRIDHIDGLLNPSGYIQKLRETIGDAYLVVEKILDRGETLPLDWSVQGTTGYEVLNAITHLFCDPSKEGQFDAVYTRFARMKPKLESLVYDHKRLMIQRYMNGDVENLSRLFRSLYKNKAHRGRNIEHRLHAALTEAIACFPVYRTYVTGERGASVPDRFYIDLAVEKAIQRKPKLVNELKVLKNILTMEFPKGLSDETRKRWTHFAMRFQQLTGPLMAKGFEDTALYVYNRLLSLNEVGGYPEQFGASVEDWSRFCRIRMNHWPFGMNASATHDTKRGEDARARINVLSEIPKEWEERLHRWHRMNRSKKIKIDRKHVPGKNEEYLLYQTLIGAFPFEGAVAKDFVGRVARFMIKAGREAKIHTDWVQTNVPYEDALAQFIETIMVDSGGNRFLNDFKRFHRRVSFFGILNSLSQTLLKIAAPGVPDFYQGTDLWDLSLVDPDNRRPVDYNLRKRLLGELIRKFQGGVNGFFDDLWKNRNDGRMKLFTIYQSLRFRRTHREIFEKGAYLPLKVAGRKMDHIVAFARRAGSSWAVIVVPRYFTSLVKEHRAPLGPNVWGDTRIGHPSSGPRDWQDIFTRRPILWEKDLTVGNILKEFPIAILHGRMRK